MSGAAMVRTRSRQSLRPMILEAGDVLPLGEFLRRFEHEPHVKKAELINGTVFMPSPVRAEAHAEPDLIVHLWLGTYAAPRNSLKAYANPTLILDAENSFQPDAVLCHAPRKGGSIWINQSGYLCGKPDLVVEVAASSASIDLHQKKRIYRRNQIPEYVVWRTLDKRIDWFVLENEDYVLLPPDRAGRLRSRAFPGLVLDTKAALKHDSAAVIALLQPPGK